MLIPRSNKKWVMDHARYDAQAKRWLCKSTGAFINVVKRQHRIVSTESSGAITSQNGIVVTCTVRDAYLAIRLQGTVH